MPREVQVTTSTYTALSYIDYPSLALGREGHVYIAWIHLRELPDGSAHVHFKRSTDSGETWPPAETQIDYSSGIIQVDQPQIAADGLGNVYIAWADARGERITISLNRSIDDGATWQDRDQIISGASSFWARFRAAYGQPQIHLLDADSNGHVYTVFTLIPRNFENRSIGFNVSTDFGVTWGSEAITIMDRGVHAVSPVTMAADQNGKIYVVMGKEGQSWLHRHMYMNASKDYGRTWACGTRACQVDSVDPNAQLNAGFGLISCSQNGHAAVVWWDGRPPNGYHLYYNTADFRRSHNLRAEPAQAQSVPFRRDP